MMSGNVTREYVAFCLQLGKVFLMGDFNARVGQKKDYITCDRVNVFTDDVNYSPENVLNR